MCDYLQFRRESCTFSRIATARKLSNLSSGRAGQPYIRGPCPGRNEPYLSRLPSGST